MTQAPEVNVDKETIEEDADNHHDTTPNDNNMNDDPPPLETKQPQDRAAEEPNVDMANKANDETILSPAAQENTTRDPEDSNKQDDNDEDDNSVPPQAESNEKTDAKSSFWGQFGAATRKDATTSTSSLHSRRSSVNDATADDHLSVASEPNRTTKLEPAVPTEIRTGSRFLFWANKRSQRKNDDDDDDDDDASNNSNNEDNDEEEKDPNSKNSQTIDDTINTKSEKSKSSKRSFGMFGKSKIKKKPETEKKEDGSECSQKQDYCEEAEGGDPNVPSKEPVGEQSDGASRTREENDGDAKSEGTGAAQEDQGTDQAEGGNQAKAKGRGLFRMLGKTKKKQKGDEAKDNGTDDDSVGGEQDEKMGAAETASDDDDNEEKEEEEVLLEKQKVADAGRRTFWGKFVGYKLAKGSAKNTDDEASQFEDAEESIEASSADANPDELRERDDAIDSECEKEHSAEEENLRSLHSWVESIKKRHEELTEFEQNRSQRFQSRWMAVQAYADVYGEIAGESLAEMQRLGDFVGGIWAAQKRFTEIMQEKKRQALLKRRSQTAAAIADNVGASAEDKDTDSISTMENPQLGMGLDPPSTADLGSRGALGLDHPSAQLDESNDEYPEPNESLVTKDAPSAFTPVLDELEKSQSIWESTFTVNSRETANGIVHALESTWPSAVQKQIDHLTQLRDDIFPAVTMKNGAVLIAWGRYSSWLG